MKNTQFGRPSSERNLSSDGNDNGAGKKGPTLNNILSVLVAGGIMVSGSLYKFNSKVQREIDSQIAMIEAVIKYGTDNPFETFRETGLEDYNARYDFIHNLYKKKGEVLFDGSLNPYTETTVPGSGFDVFELSDLQVFYNTYLSDEDVSTLDKTSIIAAIRRDIKKLSFEDFHVEGKIHYATIVKDKNSLAILNVLHDEMYNYIGSYPQNLKLADYINNNDN